MSERLTHYVTQFLESRVEYSRETVLDLYPSNRELAQELTGETKGKQYDNMMRRLQFYRSGKRGGKDYKPEAALQSRLARAIKTDPDALKRAAEKIRKIEVQVQGKITISSDKRQRKLPASGFVEITGADCVEFLQSAIDDETEIAYAIFFENYDCEIGDVEDEEVIIK